MKLNRRYFLNILVKFYGVQMFRKGQARRLKTTQYGRFSHCESQIVPVLNYRSKDTR